MSTPQSTSIIPVPAPHSAPLCSPVTGSGGTGAGALALLLGCPVPVTDGLGLAVDGGRVVLGAGVGVAVGP